MAIVFIAIPATTTMAQEKNVLASYFSNIAQGYKDYGFVYSFSSGLVNWGMDKPKDYNEAVIDALLAAVDSEKPVTTLTTENGPNIITVLLESFVDPYEFNFMTYSQDPTPFFHYLEDNFTSGYLTMPVVGAGTANAEFEILTGMKLQYFGTGEYPYKTILKEVNNCESIASVLKAIGYGTHAVHNNGGNFYSRVNAFSLMGFDSFTSKELMNITEFTPNEGWAEDSILAEEALKTLTSTVGPDLTYIITVGQHGVYPEEQVIDSETIQYLHTMQGNCRILGDPGKSAWANEVINLTHYNFNIVNNAHPDWDILAQAMLEKSETKDNYSVITGKKQNENN